MDVLRAAVQGDADVICTLDADFHAAAIVAFCAMRGMTVLDDVALLEHLRG